MIINFMLGVFKRPKKNSIYMSVERTRELARSWPHAVAFRHVARDVNEVADDMVHRARDKGCDVTYYSCTLPPDAPPFTTSAVYTYLGAALTSSPMY